MYKSETSDSGLYVILPVPPIHPLFQGLHALPLCCPLKLFGVHHVHGLQGVQGFHQLKVVESVRLVVGQTSRILPHPHHHQAPPHPPPHPHEEYQTLVPLPHE